MKKLFGTDGIRGKVDVYPIDAGTLKEIGYSFAKVMFGNETGEIYIGNDGRISAKNIEKNLKIGIEKHGSSCISVGLLPTPALGIAMNNFAKKNTAAIQITASHNQFQDNGIKLFNYKGEKIEESEQFKIEEMVLKGEKTFTENEIEIKIDDEFKNRYIQYIKKYFSRKITNDLKIKGKINVLIDCSNGAFSQIIELLFPDNLINITAINNTPNGENINLNCGATDTHQLQDFIKFFNGKKIKSSKGLEKVLKLDLGLAIDGDGDRAIFVDSSGDTIDGDDILFILSKHLKNMNTKDVVGTVMTNFGVRECYKNIDLNFIEVDVGDSNILREMRKRNSFLGGESSGHIIINDHKGFLVGDAIITFINVLEVLQRTKKSLSELISDIKRVPSRLINIEVRDKLGFLSSDLTIQIIDELNRRIDKDGRLLVRPSGTENVVRFLIEHKHMSELESLVKYLCDNIRSQ